MIILFLRWNCGLIMQLLLPFLSLNCFTDYRDLGLVQKCRHIIFYPSPLPLFELKLPMLQTLLPLCDAIYGRLLRITFCYKVASLANSFPWKYLHFLSSIMQREETWMGRMLKDLVWNIKRYFVFDAHLRYFDISDL